jgi:hypothetical protein
VKLKKIDAPILELWRKRMKPDEISSERIDLERIQELCILAEKNGNIFLSKCILEAEAIDWISSHSPQKYQLLRSTPKANGFFVELEDFGYEHLTDETGNPPFSGFLSLVPKEY